MRPAVGTWSEKGGGREGEEGGWAETHYTRIDCAGRIPEQARPASWNGVCFLVPYATESNLAHQSEQIRTIVC